MALSQSLLLTPPCHVRISFFYALSHRMLHCCCLITILGIDDETGKAMLLIYNDWKNFNFWTPYFVQGERHNSQIESEYKVTEKLMKQVNIQLARVFNISIDDIPMPLSSASHGWFEAPYWTGWHGKTPGYHFPTVMDRILKPISTKGMKTIFNYLTTI